jgi:hypothetical protein
MCDSDQIPIAQVSAASLDSADVGLIEFAQFGQLLLSQTPLKSEGPYPSAEGCEVVEWHLAMTLRLGL